MCLTATNISQVAAHHYLGAFVVGVAISWVWWRNSHGAAHDDAPQARECYAFGAGCGTVAGMMLMQYWYG